MSSSNFITIDVAPWMFELIIDKGKRYKPAILPDDIRRHSPGRCFDASAIETLRSGGKYRYVEGIALNPDHHQHWVLHGWMTDGVHAFDPTWHAHQDATGQEMPMPSVYLGIEMDILEVADFMYRIGYQGVIGNRWRNPSLADKVINSVV